MTDTSKSVLVVGFNTRPLAYSLNKAGYDIYAVDFFGDLDLYPYVKDCIIILDQLDGNYSTLRDKYNTFLADFAVKLYRKYTNIGFVVIGSGLDDAYKERKLILSEIKKKSTISANNDLDTIKKARDIESLFKYLKSQGFRFPKYCSLKKFQSKQFNMQYPFIFKKKRSAGGINVFKIDNEMKFHAQIKILENHFYINSEWMIQEYIEGTPVSCTLISNGKECEIISINRQLIGEQFLFCPKEFMYCGNIVPADISKEEEQIISEISSNLTNKLGLKGINGFDFVLKEHYPYFMECNPRVPGSIRASETILNLNLLDLHIKSFLLNEWKNIKKMIKSVKSKSYATKLILFASKEIEKNSLSKINNLEFVHDKTEPMKKVLKGEPLCTILYEHDSLSESFNGAKEIVNKINKIIE